MFSQFAFRNDNETRSRRLIRKTAALKRAEVWINIWMKFSCYLLLLSMWFLYYDLEIK